MKIEHEFTVAAPLERAWQLLTDVPSIVPCMPGAQLVGLDQDEAGADVYKGKVKVKIGPVVSEYAGTATFAEKDDQTHRAVIDAKGRDSRGAGSAAATITMSLRSEGSDAQEGAEKTTVSIDTDLKISGKIAQFGSGMIREVSEKLLGQFVSCLEGRLGPQADQEEPAGVEAAAPEPAAVGSPGTGTSGPGAAASQAGASTTTTARATSTPEVEALDLLELAGNSAARRLVPAVLGVVAVIAAIVYFVRRS